jgi:hypothetical protein
MTVIMSKGNHRKITMESPEIGSGSRQKTSLQAVESWVNGSHEFSLSVTGCTGCWAVHCRQKPLENGIQSPEIVPPASSAPIGANPAPSDRTCLSGSQAPGRRILPWFSTIDPLRLSRSCSLSLEPTLSPDLSLSLSLTLSTSLSSHLSVFILSLSLSLTLIPLSASVLGKRTEEEKQKNKKRKKTKKRKKRIRIIKEEDNLLCKL